MRQLAPKQATATLRLHGWEGITLEQPENQAAPEPVAVQAETHPPCLEPSGPGRVLLLGELVQVLHGLGDKQLLLVAGHAGVHAGLLQRDRATFLRRLCQSGMGALGTPVLRAANRELRRLNEPEMADIQRLGVAEGLELHEGMASLAERLPPGRLLLLLLVTHGTECNNACRLFWRLFGACLEEVDLALVVAATPDPAPPAHLPTPAVDGAAMAQQRTHVVRLERELAGARRALEDQRRRVEECRGQMDTQHGEIDRLARSAERGEQDLELLAEWTSEAGRHPNWNAVHAWIDGELTGLQRKLAAGTTPTVAQNYALLVQAQRALPVPERRDGTDEPDRPVVSEEPPALEARVHAVEDESAVEAPATAVEGEPAIESRPKAAVALGRLAPAAGGLRPRLLVVGGAREQPYRAKVKEIGLDFEWLSGDEHKKTDVRAAVRRADLVALLMPRVSHAAAGAVLACMREAERHHDLLTLTSPGAGTLVQAVRATLAHRPDLGGGLPAVVADAGRGGPHPR